MIKKMFTVLGLSLTLLVGGVATPVLGLGPANAIPPRCC
jgi:hypothetical protein